jgi:hypothetical protein
MGDDGNDRRATTRHPVHLGVELLDEGRVFSSAITKNASDGGLLLLTRKRVANGARIELRILKPTSDPNAERTSLAATGRVVRLEELTEAEACVWTSKAAVALDEPFGDFYREVTELSQLQVERYGLK